MVDMLLISLKEADQELAAVEEQSRAVNWPSQANLNLKWNKLPEKIRTFFPSTFSFDFFAYSKLLLLGELTTN